MIRQFITLLMLCGCLVAAGQQGRPRIGLTLSGGGAKGLAHIGILKAIDSAGLKIDYVTGTSMGAVMGSLYAVGYSGKQIEEIARSIDWPTMFSNRPPLELINVNEKHEFSNYTLELPVEKGKAKLFSGLIEGEEIWLRFGELFHPVYDIKDFSKFSIPFECIATDAATGKAVTLHNGEISKAVRSSMAIPSIFAAVRYDDTKLIDGGVVRNFPVRNAKAMGADYVIGVNLSHGLLPADKLVSSIDILYQIGFYKDADDFGQEKKMCDLLIEPQLEGFSAASFSSSDSLLRLGDETGKLFYPRFKKLADSLQAIYPDAVPEKKRLPSPPDAILDLIEVEGLGRVEYLDFQGKLGVEFGKAYSGKEIANAARRAFSSGNFRRLAFFVEPTAPGHIKLKCEVIENPRTHLKVGIHYHSYTDIALITTASTRNLLLNRSKSYLKVNWSDNFRVLARHDQSFGQRERWGGLFSVYHERFRFPFYFNYGQIGDYRSYYSSIDFKFYKLFGTTTMSGFGTSHEWLYLKPNLTTDNFTGGNQYWNTYFFYQRNSLDLKSFPRSGSYIDLQFGLIYGQKPDYNFITEGQRYTSDSLGVNFKAYEQLKFKAGKYIPLNRHWTLLAQTNNGINFNYNTAYFNFYSVGGINDFIRNQIPFIGLTENQGNTYSISTALIGIQYEPFPNIVATVRGNAGLIDFIDVPFYQLTRKKNLISGYGFSGGYRSAIGPIEISLIYNDQTNQFKGYVNMGFTF